MKIAFYKAPGQLFDKLIRFWTRSKYSHVEIIFSDGVWFTSSPRDGGVRYKNIAEDDKWDIFPLNVKDYEERTIRAWCDTQVGKRYDWLGIILSQFLPLRIQDPKRWFCSEICCKAYQLTGKLYGVVPSEEDPGELKTLLVG